MSSKLSLSVLSIIFVLLLVGGVAFAFLSDTETSTGNTFTAGEIDLGIDNHSYYNGVFNLGTTWRVDYDLSDDPPRQFFNFTDVKPGDWGEDTISLHVKTNDAWLCADVKLTSDDDNGLTEPESVDGDTTGGVGQGELADNINFFWWADDGDNVFETDETLLPAGPIGNLAVDETATVALADSTTNIWGTPGPLPGNTVKYLAKAWCFGNATMTPYTQDGGNQQSGPDDRPVLCDGSTLNNITQTDSFTADITFRAVQSRNNPNFLCSGQGGPSPTPSATPSPTPSSSPNPGEPFADDVPSVSGTFGHCCNAGDLSSSPAVAAGLITGAPDSPPDADFIQISSGSTVTARFVNNKAVDGPGNDIRIYIYDALFPATANVDVTDDPACTVNWQDAGNFPDTSNGEIDLTPLGLAEAWCVRFTDLGGPDTTFPTLGFDLDAVEAINSIAVP